MKIAIISDIHFGVNYDKPVFKEYQKEFFKTFWVEMDKRGIGTIFFLGDFFHHRRMVNFDTVELAVECWFKPAMDRGTKIYMLVGNHDVFYKTTNRLNSLDLLCWNKNIEVINEPKTLKINGKNYCFLPWLNMENTQATFKEMESTPASIVLAHLELRLDFLHIQGQMPIEKLARYALVFSGHFHSPYVKDIQGCKLQYLGSPYEMNWNDFGVKDRGWYVWDDETFNYELVANNKPIHYYHRLGDDVEWIKPWHSVRCIIPANMPNLDYEIAMSALKKKEIMKVQMLTEDKEEEENAADELNISGELDVLDLLLKYAETNKGELDIEKMRHVIKGVWDEIHEE